MDKAECIQLPPIERGTDSNVVKMLWEYVQLPAEDQRKVDSQLAWLRDSSGVSSGDAQYVVGGEKTEAFNNAMKDVIADIIIETSQFACWLHHQIYDQGIRVEELLTAHPESADLILVMADIYKELKEEEASNRVE